MTAQHGHEHHQHGHDADWDSEAYVAHWLEHEAERAAERERQYSVVRALIPKLDGDEFRYLNLGAGPGTLDETLLDHFHEAYATLVDSSLLMLEAAQKRLARFGDRVEYVQADLSESDWTGAVAGPFDIVLSTLAIHHLGDPRRIRELYAELYGLTGHGGMLLNLDLVRAARQPFTELAAWAARDGEARLSGDGGGDNTPGTLAEQLGWLAEAGFPYVDVPWKELNTALLCGIRDHIHLPDLTHNHDHGHDDGHAHGGHAHGHDHDHGHDDHEHGHSHEHSSH